MGIGRSRGKWPCPRCGVRGRKHFKRSRALCDRHATEDDLMFRAMMWRTHRADCRCVVCDGYRRAVNFATEVA